jgi:hypothetical protein
VGAGPRTDTGVIGYQLGAAAAARRARTLAAVGAITAAAPLLLLVGLTRRFAWAPSGMFWVLVGAAGALVAVRTAVQYTTAKRRLGALRIVVDDKGIATQTSRLSYAIPRERVAHIVEIEGALGGLRVESDPEPGSGTVLVANVPRGGEAFAQVRARLEQWRVIERRRRSGPAKRLLLGGLVVGAIFFLPFVVDDLAARSNLMIGVFVLVAWLAMRAALRSR